MITADSIIDMIHAKHPHQRRAARFIMTDATFLEVRKLKGADGDYLWHMDDRTLPPQKKLLGYPIEFVLDGHPELSAGAKIALVQGDWRADGPIKSRDYGLAGGAMAQLCLFIRGWRTAPYNGLIGETGRRIQNNRGQPHLTALRRAGFIEQIGERTYKAGAPWVAAQRGRMAWLMFSEEEKAKANAAADLLELGAAKQ